jgi:adenosylcobinamide-GDP ribazoletransferase
MISVIILSLVFSRSVQALFLAFLPSAKKDSSVINIFKEHLLPARIILCITVAAFIGAGFFVVPFTIALWGTVASLFVSCGFGLLCYKKIGGITGDCVGAANELAELAFIVTGVIL